MSDLFERATKQKLRFNTSVGTVSVEELWDIPLTSRGTISLDTIAKELNRAVKADDDESFVTKKSTSNTRLTLQFDIVKHIIEVRLAEAEAKLGRKAKKEKQQQILALIADKKNTELAGKTVEELTALLEEE